MIWLIGSKGMLGAEVETLLSKCGVLYVGTDLEVDITMPDAIAGFLRSLGPVRPEWMINCAAYTAVDLAEDERDSAFTLNAAAPLNLARAAKMVGATFVHISTDHVFNGEKEQDYDEDDPANPINVYGKSKLMGEIAIRETLDKHYIIRTAWMYGLSGKNFVETMLRLFRERQSVQVVHDQFGNPTYAVDLAHAIMTIVSLRKGSYGTYHFTNEGKASWYTFARAIHEDAVSLGIVDYPVEICPVATQEFPTKARRPRNSCLSKTRIRRELRVSTRDWREALQDYLKARVLRARPASK